MQTYCIILAAGNSNRFDKKEDKLFTSLYGSELIRYTLTNILKVFDKKKVFIVVNKKISKKNELLLKNYTANCLIHGGTTRFKSFKNALTVFKKDANILIHDAARPNTNIALIRNIKREIEKQNIFSVIPYNTISDTLKINKSSKYISTIREKFIITQTPQAIKLDTKIRKIISNVKSLVTDESSLFDKTKLKTSYLQGSRENIKVTNKEDLELVKKFLGQKIKIGNAFDIHKIKKGNYLILGGIKFQSNYSLVGHSDGDVVIHSLIDAFLGALAKKDIGTYFPSTNKALKNIDSTILLNFINKKFNLSKLLILNIDITIISEVIRLEKYKHKIRRNISNLLNCPISKINIKAKSSDKIGIIGKSKGIACFTTLLIYK